MQLPDQTGPSNAKSKEETGVGTVLRRVLNRVGMPSCDGCKARERAINNIFKINIGKKRG